jgi:hypothetical protein
LDPSHPSPLVPLRFAAALTVCRQNFHLQKKKKIVASLPNFCVEHRIIHCS